ncbi:MAG: FixH family protein [Alphaproteobacteria bacterium]|nr:FixH family protein [Alphaproteobacteria bacterium]MCW5740452.1 FixH family protein [Alphaproteobacteria bacterium]
MGLGLVIVVNMVLLLFALRTFPGLVVKNSYERGRGYGAEIARTEAQDALGWTLDVRHDVGAGRIVVRFADARGRAIEGLKVDAIADRPVGRLATVALPLAPAGATQFAGSFAPEARGAWDVTVTARDPAGHVFRATRRVIVR